MVCVVGSFDVYQCVRMVYVSKYPELKFGCMVHVYLYLCKLDVCE
jgi:hypothetical protein